jgi:hypothetical protein
VTLTTLNALPDPSAGPPKPSIRTTKDARLCTVCLTGGLYSEFAGRINGRSVASGWGDGKEGRHCDQQDADDCNSDDYQHRRQRPPAISEGMVTLYQNLDRPNADTKEAAPARGSS